MNSTARQSGLTLFGDSTATEWRGISCRVWARLEEVRVGVDDVADRLIRKSAGPSLAMLHVRCPRPGFRRPPRPTRATSRSCTLSGIGKALWTIQNGLPEPAAQVRVLPGRFAGGAFQPAGGASHLPWSGHLSEGFAVSCRRSGLRAGHPDRCVGILSTATSSPEQWTMTPTE